MKNCQAILEPAINMIIWKRAGQPYQYLQVSTLCLGLSRQRRVLDRLRKSSLKIDHKAALGQQKFNVKYKLNLRTENTTFQ